METAKEEIRKKTIEQSDGDPEEDLIRGVNSIEEELKKAFLVLWDWKLDFGFPMFKVAGIQVVSRVALKKWIQEVASGQPLEKITTRMLHKLKYLRDLESMEGVEIPDFESICRFARQPPDVVLRWSREEDTPIRKLKGNEVRDMSVNSADLLRWMSKMGLRRGDYVLNRPIIRINREDQPPEFF